jgi:hypothetical protein
VSAAFMLMTLVVFVAYGLFAASIRDLAPARADVDAPHLRGRIRGSRRQARRRRALTACGPRPAVG